MRFMMFMIPGDDGGSTLEEWSPTPDIVEAMTRYNEELTKAGALLALDGLRPPAEAVRVAFPGGKATVTDGPFAEAKEMVGGYWIIQARSLEEAVEWAKRVPAGGSAQIEVRQIFELSDFPEDVQAAAQLSEQPPAQTTSQP